MKKQNSLVNLTGTKQKLFIFKNSGYWFILPLAIIFIALVCGTIYSQIGNRYDGFANIGIDFKGGSVLTVEMSGAEMQGENRIANYELISTILNQNGLSAASDQNSGADAIIVRYQNSVSEGDNLVVDYNTPEMAEEMIAINNNVEQQVEDAFILKYGTNIQIQANAEMINATASSDLLKKAALSVGIAMLLMLIYTAIRFDLFSGIAALSMQINDIIIMLSFVIIFRIQINSSLIAGLITIVAYSINNTLLIFDRVRDNIKLIRTQNLKIIPGEIVDTSVNQCLTRALFTSFTTLLTISILASMGIKSLSDFALPIIFGILSGLYSSLFLAPSIWGLLMQAKLKNEIKKAKALKTQKR